MAMRGNAATISSIYYTLIHAFLELVGPNQTTEQSMWLRMWTRWSRSYRLRNYW